MLCISKNIRRCYHFHLTVASDLFQLLIADILRHSIPVSIVSQAVIPQKTQEALAECSNCCDHGSRKDYPDDGNCRAHPALLHGAQCDL